MCMCVCACMCPHAVRLDDYHMIRVIQRRPLNLVSPSNPITVSVGYNKQNNTSPLRFPQVAMINVLSLPSPVRLGPIGILAESIKQ